MAMTVALSIGDDYLVWDGMETVYFSATVAAGVDTDILPVLCSC